jgi:hypothetical protein
MFEFSILAQEPNNGANLTMLGIHSDRFTHQIKIKNPLSSLPPTLLKKNLCNDPTLENATKSLVLASQKSELQFGNLRNQTLQRPSKNPQNASLLKTPVAKNGQKSAKTHLDRPKNYNSH